MCVCGCSSKYMYICVYTCVACAYTWDKCASYAILGASFIPLMCPISNAHYIGLMMMNFRKSFQKCDVFKLHVTPIYLFLSTCVHTRVRESTAFYNTHIVTNTIMHYLLAYQLFEVVRWLNLINEKLNRQCSQVRWTIIVAKGQEMITTIVYEHRKWYH